MSTYSKTWFFAMSVPHSGEGDPLGGLVTGLVEGAVATSRRLGSLSDGLLVLLLCLDRLGQGSAALDSGDDLLAPSLGEASAREGVSHIERVNLVGLGLRLGGLHRLSDGSQRGGQAVKRLKHLLEQHLLLFVHLALLHRNVLRLPVSLAGGSRPCGLKHLNESTACACSGDDIDAQHLNERGEDRRAVLTFLSGTQRTNRKANIVSHLGDDLSEAVVELDLGVQGTVLVFSLGDQLAHEVERRTLGALELLAHRRVIHVNVSPSTEDTGVVLKHALRVESRRALTCLYDLHAPTLAELASRRDRRFQQRTDALS